MNIFDLHNDFITGKKLFQSRYFQEIGKQNVCGLISAIWTTNKTPEDVWNLVNKLDELIKESEKRNNMISFACSFEDLHFIDACNIHRVLMTKPIWCGLTWNADNKLAGGAKGNDGLSATGEKVVKILESEHVLIDTAHLNERSFIDVAHVSTGKLVCSHAAFYGCLPHQRNLKDFQIRIILESGGLIGLALVSEFLCGIKRSTVHDVFSHIDYFVQKFGSVDGLALGTDFFGTKHLPTGVKNYDDLQKLALLLKRSGYSDESIEKLFWKNASTFVFKNHVF